jgi:flagellar P-ring protein precursor FlgI
MWKKAAVVVLMGVLIALGSAVGDLYAARIKDIAYFTGNRSNQLIGYGLVVGLKGTGDKDKTQFTVSTLANLLDNMGIHVDPIAVKVKNVAAVMVTANLPAYARNGARIDAQASSMGDATSIEGGTLLMTPLQGPDGQTYAVAQGPISTGGFSASGQGGGGVTKNFPTVGYISGGVIVEKAVANNHLRSNHLELVLKNPDFTTAARIARCINQSLGGSYADAVDAGAVKLQVPPGDSSRMVQLVSQIEDLQVQPEVVAKIVINERTGTIVMGENVRISPVAIAQGSLTVQVTETPTVSQPLPFSQGQTAVVPRTQVSVQEGKGTKEGKGPLYVIGGETTITQLVKGLNAIGVTPRDLISILQAIKAAGAIQAEIEII